MRTIANLSGDRVSSSSGVRPASVVAWRGCPAGSRAVRRRAGRALRLAPGIGQAGAVPFQPCFRPVLVRPPTVPVSPVPGTARRFPRRGGQSMSRFRKALAAAAMAVATAGGGLLATAAAAAPAHAATPAGGAHDDWLHRRSRGPGRRRHRPQVPVRGYLRPQRRR
jgi:hypothetical protein